METVQQELTAAILEALRQAEEAGDVVLTTAAPGAVASAISIEVRRAFAGDLFTVEEMRSMALLISYAVADKRFYDWEMPTLVGMSAEAMQGLSDRILRHIAS